VGTRGVVQPRGLGWKKVKPQVCQKGAKAQLDFLFPSSKSLVFLFSPSSSLELSSCPPLVVDLFLTGGARARVMRGLY
jgi:hypothetical protein